jgi:transposase
MDCSLVGTGFSEVRSTLSRSRNANPPSPAIGAVWRDHLDAVSAQDRRRLTRYMRRWLVERFFAWIQWQRRILVRGEYHTQNFLGFVQLACLVILFRRF